VTDERDASDSLCGQVTRDSGEGVTRARVKPGAPLMERYQPPTGDDPLDEVEWSFVRLIATRVIADIRREEAEAAARASSPGAADATVESRAQLVERKAERRKAG
jgi:hypothetical protein